MRALFNRWLVLGLLTVAAVAGAKTDAVFPFVVGTKLTFTSTEFKDTWATTLGGDAKQAQYLPHNDVINYVTKAGFQVKADGLYIQGETLADLGDPPTAPARAVAFPITKGAVGKVPGLIPTTYTVGAREKVKVPAGTFDAWRIDITDKPNPPGAFWLAPGTGIVKIKLPSGRIDELVKIEPAK